MQSSSQDRITFIIASYNNVEIGATIDSIKKTANTKDEIIIVDGKSTDNTVIVAQKALNNFPYYSIISEQDTGIYDAWNKAIKIASGSWLVFLGCGDLLNINYREAVSNAIIDHPNSNFIHFIAQLYSKYEGGNVNLYKYGNKLDKTNFLKRMRVCHVGALHHQSLFSDLVFSTDYQCVSDYHFLLTKLSQINSHFIDETLVSMDSSGISSRPVFPHYEERKMKSDMNIYSPFALWFRFFSSVIKSYIFNYYINIRRPF